MPNGFESEDHNSRLVLAIRERLDAEVLRLVGQWDRDRGWEIDGALSPRAWLTHQTPVTNRQAGWLAKQAKQLPLADFITLMRQWASLADDELAKQEFTEKWQRRHLHASVGLDGWACRGCPRPTLPLPRMPPQTPMVRHPPHRRMGRITRRNQRRQPHPEPTTRVRRGQTPTSPKVGRHHTLVHNSRWAIKRTADGDFEFTHPTRGPYRSIMYVGRELAGGLAESGHGRSALRG